MYGMEHPARLEVGVVGAGRVGAVLGAALARAGHELSGVYAVSDASRRRAGALLPEAPVTGDIRAVIEGSELVVLAVPDDVLDELVAGLSSAGVWQAGQIVFHTSGRYGVSVLDPVVPHHVLPLALHPAMLFTGTAPDLDRILGCAFGVTAPEPLGALADALVLDMGGEPVRVPEDARTVYHAALTHGADHLVTLVAQATDVLRAAGVADPAALLGPLTRAALDAVLRSGDGALTGAVTRGDVSAVEHAVRELARISPETCATYRALARATALRALDRGRLAPLQAEPLLDTLADRES